jgi:hypothetical protein
MTVALSLALLAGMLFLLPATGWSQAGESALPDLGLEPGAIIYEEPEEPWIEEPCEIPPDRELMGLDWTRRTAFRAVCNAAAWFDGLFGDIGYEDAAPGVRGRISLEWEHREDSGDTFRPRFRVRIPLPNLQDRFSLYVEREDETQSIEGRNVEGQQIVQPPSRTQSQDSTQIGLAYRKLRLLGEVVDFRVGLRLRHGTIDYYARTRARYEFWRTDRSQWRFSETVFWRRLDGWGETTELDYSKRIADPYVFRWYNSATWAHTTEGVEWRSIISLSRSLGNNRGVAIETGLGGQTGMHVDVSTYGVRVAYLQRLGRPWLLGEFYLGEDWVKTLPGTQRDGQAYVGFNFQIFFDGKERDARLEQLRRPPPRGPHPTESVE